MQSLSQGGKGSSTCSSPDWGGHGPACALGWHPPCPSTLHFLSHTPLAVTRTFLPPAGQGSSQEWDREWRWTSKGPQLHL